MTNEIDSRRVTIKDVAQLAGVTPAMVSFTLSGKRKASPKTREAVLNAAQELGYVPNANAQRLVNGRSDDTIGLFALNLDIGVGTQKILTIQKRLQEHGFFVPLHAYGFAGAEKAQTQLALISELSRQLPHAIICSMGGLQPETLEHLHRFQSEGGVLITFDTANDLPCDQIIFGRKGPELAARHLTELGHKRIGMCLHGPADLHAPEVQMFAHNVACGGGDFRPEWLFVGGNYEEGGVRCAQWWLGLPSTQRPTGLFIINDQSAAAFTTRVARAGVRVPDDVSVVGHDNILLAAYAPVPLTTVTHPAEAIGNQVADVAIARLRGDYNGPPLRVVVPCELVRRESSGPPPPFS